MSGSSPFHQLGEPYYTAEGGYGEDNSFYGGIGDVTPKTEPISPPIDCIDEGKTYTTLVPSIRPDTGRLLSTHSSTSDFFEQLDADMPGHPIYPAMSPETDTDLRAWVNKHPSNWTSHEVLDWVYYVAEKMNCNGTDIKGELFQNLRGEDLMNMTRGDFENREPLCGSMLHDTFQDILKKSRFVQPEGLDTDAWMQPQPEPTLPNIRSFMTSRRNDQGPEFNNLEVDDTEVLDSFLESNGLALLGNDLYTFDGTEKFEGILPGCGFESGYDTEMSEETMSSGEESVLPPGPMPPLVRMDANIPLTVREATEGVSRPPAPQPTQNLPVKPAKRGPGRPRKVQQPGQEPHTPGQRGRKKGQSTKGNHLWEFIRDLLKDPALNPKIIKWEDEEDRVFRIVQSETVASMWGKKKNNANMTYEKLSRALRFCRTQGHFADVPKTGRFPKKLCFKFGQKAVI